MIFTRYTRAVLAALLLALCLSAVAAHSADITASATVVDAGKPVVYQVFPRLFGNKNSTNKPWGTVEENGVGKFSDFTPEALRGIAELGVSHIWYTGVPHHALIRDYGEYGISNDDPDVVKGRAGSPYAVKDYYSVNPDLADNPARRLEEFSALIERTHNHGMKVIIDIVPNHVARHYQSLDKPEGIVDFGASDDDTVEYRRDNNFYYVLGQPFAVPYFSKNGLPLGGEAHPLADGHFEEEPAKWTGNGARQAQPRADDWYETVKINFGVRPDGSHDFPDLPREYATADYRAHANFWRGKEVPDSWEKFRDICLYWLQLGVDGFRYDMAEMVPVEFWSYLNSSIKIANPNAFLLAEVYDYDKYRDYIQLGKMDYLYNKDELYDSLKAVMAGREPTDKIAVVREMLADIDAHMLTFLDNHDEQRVAGTGFAGDPDKARAAMVVTATIGSGPTMIYSGQEVGEAGEGNAGFGRATRTTIFDYWGLPAHQRWMNGGKFDGGLSTGKEKALRAFYADLMRYAAGAEVLHGDYGDLHSYNRLNNPSYSAKLFSFSRSDKHSALLVVASFDEFANDPLHVMVPPDIIKRWGLEDGRYPTDSVLHRGSTPLLRVEAGVGRIEAPLGPLGYALFEIDFQE